MSRFAFERIRPHKSVVVDESDKEFLDTSDVREDHSSRTESLGEVSSENQEVALESLSEPEIEAASLSFGDLARAQASLHDEQSPHSLDEPGLTVAGIKRKASDVIERLSSKRKSSQSDRTSKHAPQTLSSKYPVSRSRTILTSDKPAARDPRFDPLTGTLDATKHTRNYSFLKEYRADEIASLKSAVKALDSRKGLSITDRQAEKEDLKLTIQRLSSKAKAEQIKEKERDVVNQHRREERDKVRAGKQPYFLKKNELRKRVEEKRFEGIGEKRKEKILEKRKRKKEGKVKRLLPTRRVE